VLPRCLFADPRRTPTPSPSSSSPRPTTSTSARARTRNPSASATLIYDPLVRKDSHFNLQPWLATSWERADPLTWIFHLRAGIRFHDGHPLTAADVAWSIRSMTNGAIITAKGGAFKSITAVDTPDPLTVVVHTSTPQPSLLFNLSDGLFGVVEAGAARDEGLHPIGSGPFRFVSQVQDKEVLLDRNPTYWAGAPSPTIEHIRFQVVPDTITAALEMKKGSADVESNVLTMDMVHAFATASPICVFPPAPARASTTSTSTCRIPPFATRGCARPLLRHRSSRPRRSAVARPRTPR
jgi:ABC-type transport system substrate-binding protein